jgi:hypothetical protein
MIAFIFFFSCEIINPALVTFLLLTLLALKPEIYRTHPKN